ncbi:MAG: DNA translocase FtsK 4TM domain-containing protein [Bacteroidales bacterium]|nr:DNA translocase FtsK 4TM domain-containing protein [Bacteroidales bacterium]
MMRKTKDKKTKKTKNSSNENSLSTFVKSEQFPKIIAIIFAVFTVFCFVSFVSFYFTWFSNANLDVNNWCGPIGARVANFFINKTFGIASFGFLFLLSLVVLRLFKTEIKNIVKWIISTLVIMLWLSCFIGFFVVCFPSTFASLDVFAGVVGIMVNQWLVNIIGTFGTALFNLAFTILFPKILFNVSYSFVRKFWNSLKDKEFSQTPQSEKPKKEKKIEPKPQEEKIEQIPAVIEFDIEPQKQEEEEENLEVEFEIQEQPQEEEEVFEEEEAFEEEEMEHYGIDTPYDPKLELSSFVSPTVDILIDYEKNNKVIDEKELLSNKDRIVNTLRNYKIDIVKISATPGPTVTLYEIVPAPGTRINKIKNLEDDIALSLSALGIRIIAPIPGKGTIGIEVPNFNPQIVSMKTMLTSPQFVDTKYELPIAIGKTISSEPYVADLAKMPHLLMAGATGQGKSVGLNAIISSLLFKKHPCDLKFVMVDPKKVELSLYSKIERHYLAKLPDSEEAIITDVKKVVRTLNSLCIEMDQRYDLLKIAGCKKITEYNAKFCSRRLLPTEGHRYLPYIVLVIDEFADLIMTAGKEIEMPIARLAQLARAVGIHLIIATQRPTVNIITGTIKANFPARIAFKVSSRVDSKTILDTSGAEQLIGRGDMLISAGSDLIRLQCALIDTEEIEKLSEYIGSQRGFDETFLLPEYLDETSEPSKEVDMKQLDPKFEESARLVVMHQHGSTSLIQRKLSLGYNRAGRIIDQLEAAGIVGPFEGSKAREVLVKTEVELNEILNEYLK